MSQPPRIGLVGLGTAGLRHAAACRKTDDVVLVAAADPSPAAAAAASSLRIPCYNTYEWMLEAVALDAVIISLPHVLLSAAGVTCARRGLHVLIEKPMGTSIPETEAVIAAARAAGVRLMVNFVHRFRAEYRQAKALIEAGVIGRPVLVMDSMSSGRSEMPAWVWDRSISGGGMMMYNGVHSLDRLAWLVASPINRVCGVAGTFSYPVEVEDNLVGAVVFRSGTLGAVIQHKSKAPVTLGGWDTAVWGTKGALTVSGGVIEVGSDKERTRLEVREDDRFVGALHEFAGAIQDEREPSPNGEDGKRALAAVLGLYEASATGRTIELAE